MQLDKDSAILIFSHERQNLLKKSVNYYNKFSNNIIILDSSKKKINFNKNIKYFHLPKLSIQEKIIFGLKNCKQKYIVISPDDDFFLIRSINKATKFLKKNNDYISAGGFYYYFKIYGNKLIYNRTYRNYRSINQKDITERIKDVSADTHTQFFYSIYNRKILLKCFSYFSKSKKNISAHEYVTTFIPLLFGKHKHLNITWMLRGIGINIPHIITNKYTYTIEYKIFINTFCKLVDSLKIKKKKIILKKYLDNYFSSREKIIIYPKEFNNSYLFKLLKKIKYSLSLFKKYDDFLTEEVLDIKKIEKIIFKG